MDSHYQPQPGQYSQPQIIQSPQILNANGPATAYDNHQFHGPQASEATTSSTTAITQQYTVPSAPPMSAAAISVSSARRTGRSGSGLSSNFYYGYEPICSASTYTQNQQPMVSRVSQQPSILQPQLQPRVMLQQPKQHLPQHYSIASGMQYSDQSQQMTQQQQQQQMFQKSIIPQQPQQPPAIDFTQLLESSPAPQQVPGNDFSQLMQAAPPVNTSSSVVTTTTTRTEFYKGANAGGKARKQAEAKGEKEVQRFEQKVRKLIRSICPCPMNAPWYNGMDGYICGEGIHFLYHKDIDRAFAQPGWMPRVTWVNTLNDPEARGSGTFRFVHPPPIAFHEPMHRIHRNFMQAVRRDGSFEIQASGSEGDGLQGSGCDDECMRGIDTVSKAESHRHLRENGFNPHATRHAMFS